jgi:glycosyltransferase involved in cell wall biosynthesis
MNILFIAPKYPSVYNNFRAPFFREQAIAIGKRHNVTYVSAELHLESFSSINSLSFIKKDIDGIQLHELAIKKGLPLINSYLHVKQATRYIERYIDLRKIDVIHCQTSFIAGAIAYKLNKKYDIPYVITEHSYYTKQSDLIVKKQFRPEFKSALHKHITTRNLKNASAVIAVGKYLKADINSFISRDIDVVPNVVNTDRFSLNREGSDTIRIGVVGNLTPPKGIDILIDAVAKIKNKNTTLQIVGDGLEMDNLKQLAKERGIENRCIFRGHIPPDNIGEFYKTTDIFVLPSKHETFGVVLVEAIASGIPVITTLCGEPENIVTPEIGIVANRADSNDLATKIDTMIDTIDNYSPKELRDHAINNYGTDSFNNKIDEIYRRVTG